MKPWKIVAKRQLFDGRPWLRLWADDVHLPDGRVVENFYTLEMPDFVVVVAFTPEGLVVAERNYKHGARRVCLNMPAGYLNEGESALAAAQRELFEETGYRAPTWVPLGSFTNDGNRGGGVGHFFLARDARPEGEPDSGDLEQMEIVLLPLGDALAALGDGGIPVVSSAAALALAALHTGASSPLSGS